MRPRRWRDLVLLVLLVVAVNAPLIAATYRHHHLESAGVDVAATVLGVHDEGGRYAVFFRFDPALDPAQTTWSAEVPRSTYDSATATRAVDVLVLPGHPATYEVSGQVRGHGATYFTVIGDLLLLVVGVLVWRFRQLRKRETGDAQGAA